MSATVVVVTGPPASGKTTLARAIALELGWPLYTKDTFKELLFDTLGIGDLGWSAKLGGASMELLSLVLRTELEAGRSLVVEANFRRLDPLPPCRAVQVFCGDSPEALEARYRARTDRHPGHVDGERALPDLAAYGPLDLDGPLIRYRLGDDVLDEVLQCVR